MTTEERSNPEVEGMTDVNPSPEPLVPEVGKEPTVPPGITVAESREFQGRAAMAVKELEVASGGKEMELVDSITAVGTQAQRQASGGLELLRARVGDMIAREGIGSRVTKDLVDLRLTLDKINPHELSRTGLRRVINALPIVKRLSSLAGLKKIAIRYETVSTQVRVVEDRLREGRTMLARDNIELRMLYEQVETQQLVIIKNAYLGELLMQQLEEMMERIGNSPKAARVRDVLHDVSIRVQDLRTLEEVHLHLFIGIEMTRQNNTRMGQSVDRTLALAINVVMVGLALQSALERQKRVLESDQRTREFIGDMLVANAASVRQHTEEIGDIYNNPIVAIDKLTTAHNDLIEAINMVDRLKIEGIDAARNNIIELNKLSGELRQKLEGASVQQTAGSIEA